VSGACLSDYKASDVVTQNAEAGLHGRPLRQLRQLGHDILSIREFIISIPRVVGRARLRSPLTLRGLRLGVLRAVRVGVALLHVMLLVRLETVSLSHIGTGLQLVLHQVASI
jgi:hypothetical protein